LDKAVNADSENASKQLRTILLLQNPQWKLPERRVARYLKRHLKARNNPVGDQIEVDMDEETVFTSNGGSRAVAVESARPNKAAVKIETVPEGAYADENDVVQSKQKPLFCEGLECVIS